RPSLAAYRASSRVAMNPRHAFSKSVLSENGNLARSAACAASTVGVASFRLVSAAGVIMDRFSSRKLPWDWLRALMTASCLDRLSARDPIPPAPSAPDALPECEQASPRFARRAQIRAPSVDRAPCPR